MGCGFEAVALTNVAAIQHTCGLVSQTEWKVRTEKVQRVSVAAALEPRCLHQQRKHSPLGMRPSALQGVTGLASSTFYYRSIMLQQASGKYPIVKHQVKHAATLNPYTSMFMSWERIFFAIRMHSQENETQNVWSTRRNSFPCLLLQKDTVSSSNRRRDVNIGLTL